MFPEFSAFKFIFSNMSIRISDFYKVDGCNAASYDNYRKIASVVDGFKPSGRKIMYTVLKKNVTSHVGRHTYACLCLAAGVRIEAVQRTLGHTDIRTTQIYAKLVDQDVDNAFANAKLDGVG